MQTRDTLTDILTKHRNRRPRHIDTAHNNTGHTDRQAGRQANETDNLYRAYLQGYYTLFPPQAWSIPPSLPAVLK